MNITKEQLISIGKGALIAMVGALLTYSEQTITTLDFGMFTEVAVMLNSILVNYVRKVLGL